METYLLTIGSVMWAPFSRSQQELSDLQQQHMQQFMYMQQQLLQPPGKASNKKL